MYKSWAVPRGRGGAKISSLQASKLSLAGVKQESPDQIISRASSEQARSALTLRCVSRSSSFSGSRWLCMSSGVV